MIKDVPRLIRSVSGDFDEILELIDKDLEHWFILPIEFELNRDRKSFWGSMFHEALIEVKKYNFEGARARLLMMWPLIFENYTSKHLKSKARRQLKKYGIFFEAQDLFRRVSGANRSKAELLGVLVREFDIPVAEVEFLTNDGWFKLGGWMKYYLTDK